jgi:hypothetical protein
MQSDFKLMEYAYERRGALRKNGLIMLAAGFLLMVITMTNKQLDNLI